jgi:hypothetical protein
MLNKSSKDALLEKILASREFTGSKIYQSYLTYLVNAAEEGRSLKETTIAIDFFEKDADFNPAEDATVRTHTYNLRKKLETYYLKEGKEDKYQVKIPKGHYDIEIVPASKEDFSFRYILKRLSLHKLYIFIILILFFSLVFLFIRNRTLEDRIGNFQVIGNEDVIWKDYLSSDLPVLIAVGDHFFFSEYNESYQNLLAIRDGNINSLEELEAYKSKYPDKILQQADEPYFPYHSIWSLPPILSILYSNHQKPILRKSSALSPQILDEYNIIFVGSIKTLYILKYTLSESHFNFEISPHRIIYTPPDGSETQEFKTNLHSSGPNEDLTLALKLPGPANNSIFIIASYHSLGAPEIANYLTTPSMRQDLINKFIEKYGYVPQYFEVLFRVTGIDKTAYNTEVLIYNEIVRENESLLNQ